MCSVIKKYSKYEIKCFSSILFCKKNSNIKNNFNNKILNKFKLNNSFNFVKYIKFSVALTSALITHFIFIAGENIETSSSE